MTDPALKQAATERIADISLDSKSIVTRSTDIEIERHKAISDLLDGNSFSLVQHPGAGPYRVALTLKDDRLLIRASCARTGAAEDLHVSLSALKPLMKDYAILCENFYKTARQGQIHKLETIDAGRRALHDEAAEILSQAIEKSVKTDKATARRLFSLLYVLHMRTNPTLS